MSSNPAGEDDGSDVVASKKAPRNDDGTFFYVKTTRSWGKAHEELVKAVSLTDAKQKYGWTRQQHASIKVHRASVVEVARLPWYGGE